MVPVDANGRKTDVRLNVNFRKCLFLLNNVPRFIVATFGLYTRSAGLHFNERLRRQAVFADWKSVSIPVKGQSTHPYPQKTQNTKGLLCLNAD